MHKSVLLQEVVNSLALKEGGAYIDATVGGGGHSEEILEKIGKNGKLLAIDKDESALKIAQERLNERNVVFVQGDFKDITEIAVASGFKPGSVDGIIADLGVSSMQLDEAGRGFSFAKRAKLDMRMDRSQPISAKDVVNEYSEADLTRIFRNYGEEPFGRRIAKEIIKTRETHPIIWTDQLAEVVRRGMGIKNSKFDPPAERAGIRNSKFKRDPATKVFQALRIEVNGELSALESALPQMVSILKQGGRMAVISFHSLEDRIVKQFIERELRGCVCPPEFPKCICGKKPTLKKVTKKPVVPQEEEIRKNPRSRSAKLRVAEKI